MNFKAQVWNFFENPKSRTEIIFKYFITILILVSSFSALYELISGNQALGNYSLYVGIFDFFVLGIFTFEFIFRFFSSPSKLVFIKDKFNWIDFLAVFPFYLGIDNLMILRIFRLLRLFRLLKISKQIGINNFFNFKNSIVSQISLFVFVLVAVKGFIMLLEQNGYWFYIPDLGIIFTILGFALGIVLSNKIGNSYKKYLQLEDAIFALQGALNTVTVNLNLMAKEQGLGRIGIKISYEWLKEFLDTFKGEKEGAVRRVRLANRKMHEDASKLGNTTLIPFHRLSAMMGGVFTKSTFILGKRVSFTPDEYDKFVLHIVVFYILMLIIFIPGVKGLISVTFASYLLYGLYYLTKEFDYISGSDFDSGIKNLITLDIERLEHYCEDLGKEMKDIK